MKRVKDMDVTAIKIVTGLIISAYNKNVKVILANFDSSHPVFHLFMQEATRINEQVLVIFNDDKPGVIGAVGTVCGRHNINICTMGVGQKIDEQKAVLAVSLDQEPDDKAIEELRKLDFVNELYVVNLY